MTASSYSTNYESIGTNIKDDLSSVGASIANVFVSVVKGVSELAEAVFDVAVLVGTGINSIATGAVDLFNYISDKDSFESQTKNMWKETMAFVAENHVENTFSNFYKNNAIGKWLDEHATDSFKSTGSVSQIASGIGYVAGIVLLTLATCGVADLAIGAGSLSSTAVSAGFAAAAGTGKYTRCSMGKYERQILGRHRKII